MTPTEFRSLALSMPGAEEKSHFEQPDFRVKNKIFAGLSVDEKRGTLKLGPDVQAMVLDARPKVFSAAAGAWGRSGWTHVEISKAKLPEIRELLAEAWRLVAPKKLVAEQGGLEKPRTPSKRGLKKPRAPSKAGRGTKGPGR